MSEHLERRWYENDRAVRELISKTVTETLLHFGFDVTSPLEIQQDLAHLRSMRKRSAAARTAIERLLYSTVGGGVLLALWEGFRHFFYRKIGEFYDCITRRDTWLCRLDCSRPA